MTALHLQMRVQQEYLISMHTVADVHKYVWNFDRWYWNGDPEYKRGNFQIHQI